MESTELSAVQRICVETDVELPPLALDPELPVFDGLPTEVPLPAVAPPTELLVLAVLLPPVVLLVALLLEVVDVPIEVVPTDAVTPV